MSPLKLQVRQHPGPKYFQSDLISVCSRVFVNNGEARFSGEYG